MPRNKAAKASGQPDNKKKVSTKGNGKGFNKKPLRPNKSQKKNAVFDGESKAIMELQRRIMEEAPPRGTNPLAADQGKKSKKGEDKKNTNSNSDIHAGAEWKSNVTYTAARDFSELPLSSKTQEALLLNSWTRMTDIQRASLPHTLAGRDVLGAARTGSGKTLAFLIPMLELLYRMGWNDNDGLGALVISPTRELSMQIFEVLRKVGCKHFFSAGLIIGGKPFPEEQLYVNTMHILICTPGRLLQHMDQTYGFTCDQLQVLVLDEADRILDMGFSSTLNSILQNLPKQSYSRSAGKDASDVPSMRRRQTLLFSATQTKSIKDLARLSLHDPEYIAVHEEAGEATPAQLTQTYMVLECEQKIDMLYSFIKSHLTCKTIVFVSTCKQVAFLWEVLRRMQPGVPLMAIHGQMKQAKRMMLYHDFLKRPAAVLFATDLAARGLDFPAVDWVVQYDCAEDTNAYIHRVGRTARYRTKGKSLMFVLPSESHLLTLLEDKKIPLHKVMPNASKIIGMASRFQGFLMESPDVKYLAQKALVGYVRSVYLQSDKSIFDVTQLDLEAIATSYGLNVCPKIKFLPSQSSKKNMSHALREEMEKIKEAKERKRTGEKKVRKDDKDKDGKSTQLSATEKLLKRKNATVFSDHRAALRADYSDEEDDDDLLVRKKERRELDSDDDSDDGSDDGLGTPSGSDDDDEDEDEDDADLIKGAWGSADDGAQVGGVAGMKERMQREDAKDKLVEQRRVKEKREKKKQAEKDAFKKLKGANNGEGQMIFEPGSDLSDNDGSDESRESEEESEDEEDERDNPKKKAQSESEDESEEEEEEMVRPFLAGQKKRKQLAKAGRAEKKQKQDNTNSSSKKKGNNKAMSLQDEEALALKFLERGGR